MILSALGDDEMSDKEAIESLESHSDIPHDNDLQKRIKIGKLNAEQLVKSPSKPYT
jgi:hypothetical protein